MCLREVLILLWNEGKGRVFLLSSHPTVVIFWLLMHAFYFSMFEVSSFLGWIYPSQNWAARNLVMKRLADEIQSLTKSFCHCGTVCVTNQHPGVLLAPPTGGTSNREDEQTQLCVSGATNSGALSKSYLD